jgi:hypothetical protein
MPWEVTIRGPNDKPLGDRETVVKLISAAVLSMDWFEEPPLLERIKDMPDHPFHALIPTWPEETRASFARSKLYGHLDAGEFSIRLYGFEAQPISSVCAEIRGNGNPVPLLAAICKPNGWFATDDRDGQRIDLDAESAKGWEWFREYRDRVIRSGESTEG